MSSAKLLTTLLTLILPLATAQLISSLPDCIQDCIEQSPDTNCSILDIACICRASSGNFLPDTITCIHSNCDNNLDNNLLLAPLQLACNLAGAPIPSSAIRNGELLASSLKAQATVTVTSIGLTPSGSSAKATTTASPEIISATIGTQVVSWTNNWFGSSAPGTSVERISSTRISTRTTTREGSSTLEVLIPVGVGASTTVTGSGITFTPSSASSATTRPSTSATAATQISTSASTAAVTSSTLPKQTSAPDDSESNSSPFKTTNFANRNELGSAFGLIFAVAVLCLWI